MKPGFSSPLVYSGHSNWVGSGRDRVVDTVCKSYSARELHLATDGFSQGNMISSGDHGEVYRGILLDGQRVAVKKFLSKSDNVDEFIEEVEAIWCIRHKNLVKLRGGNNDQDMVITLWNGIATLIDMFNFLKAVIATISMKVVSFRGRAHLSCTLATYA